MVASPPSPEICITHSHATIRAPANRKRTGLRHMPFMRRSQVGLTGSSLTGTLSCQEAPARPRVDPEALAVAFVNILPRLVCLLFGEVSAGEMRLEPRKVCFPTGCGLGCERAVVEDVGEDQQAAVFLSGQLEAVSLAAEGPGQAVGCIDLGHLAGRAVGLEGLTRRRCPVGVRRETIARALPGR